MSKKIAYKEGNVDLAAIVADFTKEKDVEYIRACLTTKYPHLFEGENCANCGALMKMYVFIFDTLVAVLLCAMAKEVRERQNKGLDFTLANQVHVPNLPTTLAVKCRTTIASKLGLVAKVLVSGSKKQVPGVWCITERGWAALRGERVPAQVRVWRKEIDERFDETITLSEAFKVHADKIKAAIRRNKEPKNDYRQFIDEYNPQDWVGFGGYHEGKLF